MWEERLQECRREGAAIWCYETHDIMQGGRRGCRSAGGKGLQSGVMRHMTSRSVGGEAAGEEMLQRELIQALGKRVGWPSLYLLRVLGLNMLP